MREESQKYIVLMQPCCYQWVNDEIIRNDVAAWSWENSYSEELVVIS